MADITMCSNKSCPSSNSCYRFNAPANEFRQSYCHFKPEHPDLDKCDYYWKDIRLDHLKKNNGKN